MEDHHFLYGATSQLAERQQKSRACEQDVGAVDDQVQAYLAAYQIESVVEGAVNDAVLKQVKVRVSPRLLSATAALAQPMCLQPRPA